MSRHMSKFDPNILRPSNSGKHVDRLRSKCSNKWPYFVNSLPGPVMLAAYLLHRAWKKRQAGKSKLVIPPGATPAAAAAATAAAAAKAKAIANAAATAKDPSPEAKAITKPRRVYNVDRSKQQATGARLMDQERMASATMTYAGLEEIEKDIMGPTVQQLMAVAQENSDGEGQFLEMLQSMGFKVVDPQDGSGQVHLIPPEGAAFEEGEENAGQDGEDGASGMYVPEEEIMEEMMGDVMGDEEGYDEDQDEEDYEDDYEEEGDFDVIY